MQSSPADAQEVSAAATAAAATQQPQQTVTAEADSGVNLYILAGHEAMQLWSCCDSAIKLLSCRCHTTDRCMFCMFSNCEAAFGCCAQSCQAVLRTVGDVCWHFTPSSSALSIALKSCISAPHLWTPPVFSNDAYLSIWFYEQQGMNLKTRNMCQVFRRSSSLCVALSYNIIKESESKANLNVENYI